MKVYINFDAEKEKPVVCLEADTQSEEDQLQLLAAFSNALFRLIVDQGEKEEDDD